MNKFVKFMKETDYKIFKDVTEDRHGKTLSVVIPEKCTIMTPRSDGEKIIGLTIKTKQLPKTISGVIISKEINHMMMRITFDNLFERVNIISKKYYNRNRYFIFIDEAISMVLTTTPDNIITDLTVYDPEVHNLNCDQIDPFTIVDISSITSYQSRNFSDREDMLAEVSSVGFIVDVITAGKVETIPDDIKFEIPACLLIGETGYRDQILTHLFNQVCDKYMAS